MRIELGLALKYKEREGRGNRGIFSLLSAPKFFPKFLEGSGAAIFSDFSLGTKI